MLMTRREPTANVNFSGLDVRDHGGLLQINGAAMIHGHRVEVSVEVPGTDGAWVGFSRDGQLLTEYDPMAASGFAEYIGGTWVVVDHSVQL